MRRLTAGLLPILVAGCVTTTGAPPPDVRSATPPVTASVAARNFAEVVARVEPVAERECATRAPGMNCDFQIVVDDAPGQPANAYQTLDPSGRPVIAFTTALIADARNPDELAFIMGHEAAHHIRGHIAKQQSSAVLGAALLGAVASARGAGQSGVETAQRFGAAIGARVFSQDMELSADALGTVIADAAGYDPLRGSLYFARIPDPGETFLGTHPPNAERQKIVQQVAGTL